MLGTNKLRFSEHISVNMTACLQHLASIDSSNHVKTVRRIQECAKRLAEFTDFSNNVYSNYCPGDVYTNVNVDTDVCNVMNIQDVNHQSTNPVGGSSSFSQGESCDAQNGNQPNRGGGCSHFALTTAYKNNFITICLLFCE